MASKVQEILASQLFERDAKEFSFCDSLDVKTSVALAIMVFLAGLSEEFLRTKLNAFEIVLQFTSIAALIGGAVFGILELWPRDYGVEAPPREYLDWSERLSAYFGEEEDKANEVAAAEIIRGRILRATERVEQNIITNRRKTYYLNGTFLCTAISLIANLFTLVSRLF